MRTSCAVPPVRDIPHRSHFFPWLLSLALKDGTGADDGILVLVVAAGNNYLKANVGCCVGVALNLFDLIWDFLKQSFLFIVGVIILFLVVSRLSSDDFFLQYSAKDAGLTIEALHAARGDVTLPYGKLTPGKAFDYHYASNYVELRTTRKEPPKEGEQAKEPSWTVRKRYGQDLSVGGINVTESVLLNPRLIIYTLRDNKLRVAESADETTACRMVGERPRRMETLLNVAGESPLITEATRKLEAAYRPSAAPKTLITFTAVPGGTLGLSAEGDAQLASVLTCLLSRKLLVPVTNLPTVSGTRGSATTGDGTQGSAAASGAQNTERRVIVTLTHPSQPDQLPPGLTDEKVATALAQTLEVVLE